MVQWREKGVLCRPRAGCLWGCSQLHATLIHSHFMIFMERASKGFYLRWTDLQNIYLFIDKLLFLVKWNRLRTLCSNFFHLLPMQLILNTALCYTIGWPHCCKRWDYPSQPYFTNPSAPLQRKALLCWSRWFVQWGNHILWGSDVHICSCQIYFVLLTSAWCQIYLYV